jgi:DNA gyrase subunit A
MREIGRAAYGVRGIRLREKDEVIGIEIVKKPFMVIVSENGFGKIIDVSEFRAQHRGGMGVIGMKVNEKTGSAMALRSAEKENTIFLVSSKGKSIASKISEIREVSRYASGVKLMDLEEEGDKVVSASVIVSGLDVGEPEPEPPKQGEGL